MTYSLTFSDPAALVKALELLQEQANKRLEELSAEYQRDAIASAQSEAAFEANKEAYRK